MKPMLAILAALLAVPATAQTDDESEHALCEPYCIAFRQLGDEHVAVAIDATGAFVAWTPVEGVAGPMLSAMKFDLPGRPVQYGGGSFERDNCTYKVARERYETKTHHVTVITITTRCDGKLIDVAVPVVSVRKADVA